jgi:hypothetical protein
MLTLKMPIGRIEKEEDLMSGMKLCTPQPTYVIVEQIHSKGGIPQFGNTVGPSMLQLYRRVIQTCDEQDMFFKGKRINGMPSTWQYIQEFLKPGKQITTRPTGVKEFVLAYAGFKNLLTPLPKIGGLVPASWTKEYDLGTPPVAFVYGTDPIPQVQLYGNPQAQFVMSGGKAPPIAVGLYHKGRNLLELPSPAERERVIKQLVQPKPSRQ